MRAGESPEAWLAGLDKVGWNFGLDRINRLCELLGLPQRRFATIHVVGSNGKTSVARMTEALLGAHGLRTGAYVSPHLERWSERILIAGEEIGPGPFGEAAKRVAEAASVAERGFEPGERVTQFEAATATAFLAMALAEIGVGVIEAGLGGRLDATNVIPSSVTSLSSISLEHTDYLGNTEEEIAAEKLAVLRPHSTLVVGRLSEGVMRLAREAATGRAARLVEAAEPQRGAADRLDGYQRRNFAVAIAAAEAFLGETLEPAAVASVAGALSIPARLELIESDPPLVLDAAHNPGAAQALCEALPGIAGGRPIVAVIALLADKPAEDVCAPIARACEHVVCTEIPDGALVGAGRPGARSHAAEDLRRACEAAGAQCDAVEGPNRALEQARALARKVGGVVLVTGSFYLLAALREQARAGLGSAHG